MWRWPTSSHAGKSWPERHAWAYVITRCTTAQRQPHTHRLRTQGQEIKSQNKIFNKNRWSGEIHKLSARMFCIPFLNLLCLSLSHTDKHTGVCNLHSRPIGTCLTSATAMSRVAGCLPTDGPLWVCARGTWLSVCCHIALMRQQTQHRGGIGTYGSRRVPGSWHVRVQQSWQKLLTPLRSQGNSFLWLFIAFYCCATNDLAFREQSPDDLTLKNPCRKRLWWLLIKKLEVNAKVKFKYLYSICVCAGVCACVCVCVRGKDIQSLQIEAFTEKGTDGKENIATISFQ